MFQINNIEAIKKRGGYICGNDNFHIVQCTNCGAQYLYNDEMIQIYHDPDDLTNNTLDIEGAPPIPCRECGKENFETEQLDEDDQQKVREGPWSYLLKNA